MCVVSMIMDHYSDEWYDRWRKYVEPQKIVTVPVPVPMQPLITPEEIAEFRRLLERAREYDKRNNEPDCELESKRQRVKELAKELGVDIEIV